MKLVKKLKFGQKKQFWQTKIKFLLNIFVKNFWQKNRDFDKKVDGLVKKSSFWQKWNFANNAIRKNGPFGKKWKFC